MFCNVCQIYRRSCEAISVRLSYIIIIIRTGGFWFLFCSFVLFKFSIWGLLTNFSALYQWTSPFFWSYFSANFLHYYYYRLDWRFLFCFVLICFVLFCFLFFCFVQIQYVKSVYYFLALCQWTSQVYNFCVILVAILNNAALYSLNLCAQWYI